MLAVKHVTIEDAMHTIIFHDVSFSLPNFGFVQIRSNSEVMNEKLSLLLAGMLRVKNGSLQYNENIIEDFSEENRAIFRSTFACGCFDDFYLQKQKSVIENVVMDHGLWMEQVDELLKEYELADKKDVLIEDLSIKEQFLCVLARSMLQQPLMLVFHVHENAYAKNDLQAFYACLQTLSTKILVVVFANEELSGFYNRLLEFQDGYLISDSLEGAITYPQGDSKISSFVFSRSMLESIHERILGKIQWKLRWFTLGILIGFMALTTAIFAGLMDQNNIEEDVLKQQGNHYFQIHKKNNDNKGNEMNVDGGHYLKGDIAYLKSKVSGEILYSYVLNEDQKQLNQSDSLRIHESKNFADLHVRKIVGEYPKNMNEVSLTYPQALSLLAKKYENKELQSAQKFLNKTFQWRNQSLKIVGILFFPGTDEDALFLQKSMFVKKGFLNAHKQNHAIIEQVIFQSDRKSDRLSGLRTLQNEEIYEVDMEDSQFLYIFFRDLFEIRWFLLVVGIVAFVLTFIYYRRIINYLSVQQRGEMSVYYGFGVTYMNIQSIYLSECLCFCNQRLLFGWFCGTLGIALFLFLSFLMHINHWQTMWYFVIPLLIYVGWMCTFQVYIRFLCKRVSWIHEYLEREERR